MQIHDDQALSEQFNELSLDEKNEKIDIREAAIVKLNSNIENNHNNQKSNNEKEHENEEQCKPEQDIRNTKQGQEIKPDNKNIVEEKSQNHTIIEGSIRPDGSKRKDIKIRAGYMNPEMGKKYVIPQKRVISQKQ